MNFIEFCSDNRIVKLRIEKRMVIKKMTYVVFLLVLLGTSSIRAQYAPENKKFGFGIMIGDPTGGTTKLWLNHENALAFSLGSSFFGSPRIGVDYLWHFNAFETDILNLYAGPGGVIGIGEGGGFWYKNKFVRTNNKLGLAARGIFGLGIIPRRTPLEIFVEMGVLLAIVPDFESAIDAALGFRFYP